MLAEELIVDNIPPLRMEDTGETALQWMDDFKISHLSVVNQFEFLGTISESDILGMADLGEKISGYKELLNPVFVTQRQHIFEVVKVVNDHSLSIIPVLDSQEHYKGSITIAQIMEIIADMPVANNPGGILVLELNHNDYSLQEIAGIIEGHNAKILGSFVTSSDDSTKMQLTIKINKTDLHAIITTLQRFEYNIIFFEENSDFTDDLKDRFDSFMSYLNV
ncbi:MAG: CBS domain-containing protein [Flavobacteriales bacterium]|nr:CBS domain-containing protein [Flavobacteriales bacterium]NCG28961.1 CBS domain-containing protein [Bacteroidota bacterium]MBT3963297.1 CBS domain-containing protein [Flavobacteriales bacterium]MBT4706183.1 CBS domain-containing protein [Flavobacteriales bacterium]MBT4931368.1 CBS domain-containing protein [Flavobacteriales bacterium]